MGRAQRDGRWWYYLDDGLYGTFSGQVYDHSRFPVEPLAGRERPRFPCVMSGPTCDSIDVVAEDLPMPELEIGELLVARQIGAYTIATATDFNFFPRARVVAVNVERADGTGVGPCRRRSGRRPALLVLSNVFMTFAWYAHLKELNHRSPGTSPRSCPGASRSSSTCSRCRATASATR